MGCKQVTSKQPITVVQVPVIREINLKFMIEENKIVKKVAKSSERLNDIIKEIGPTIEIPKHGKINYFWKKNKITDLSQEIGKMCSENDMVIDVIKAGLEFLPLNFIEEFVKITWIGKPIWDPFEVVVLDIRDKKAMVESNLDITGFSYFSAYCNGGDHLFLSGGDSQTKKAQASTSFVSMKLATKEVEHFSMPTARKCHSMIYVPNRYVFIVGGAQTWNVDYFNTSHKTFTKHSTLNKEHIEPSLALVDNAFIYALGGFKQKDTTNQFERINLRSDSTTWENITVTLTNNLIFTQHFFAVAQYRENELIFIGGVDHSKGETKCTVFDYENCTLSTSTQPQINEEFGEKYFIPFDVNKSYQFANISRENIRVFICSDAEVKDIKFDPDQH